MLNVLAQQMPATPEEIGQQIKKLRKAKGLTQKELAEKLGISESTFAHFETGRTNMTLATMNKIAESLEYDLNVSFTPKRKDTKKHL